MRVAFLKKSSAKNFLAFWDRVRSREVCDMSIFEKATQKTSWQWGIGCVAVRIVLWVFLKKSDAKNFLAMGDKVRSREDCAMGVFEKKRCKNFPQKMARVC